LVEPVVTEGCAPKLLGSDAHPFFEAQIACDTFLGVALVDEALNGAAGAPRVAALQRLLSDAQGRGLVPFRRAPDSVLARGYQLILFAGLQRLGGLESNPAQAEAFDTLARAVAADVTRAGAEGRWVESFRGAYWPCDSAPAAAGLLLHGALRHDEATSAAGRALAARLEALRTAPGGFVTRVDKKGGAIEKTPRGTTMAWTAAFLALAGAPEGRSFADDFVARFCSAPAKVRGLSAPAACREWPRGQDRKPDAVSGPIVEGWGTGASALGIAATRANGRGDWATPLTALAELFEAAGAVPGVLPTVKQGPLEQAILRWGAGARPWLPMDGPHVAPPRP
jgi:hypothetical protein